MRKTLTGLVAAGLVMALSACGSSAGSSGKGIDANQGAVIGIAMPTKTQQRWVADGNNMVDQFTEMGYKVNLQYADNDVKRQVSQVRSMVDQGDKLLVIAAVDGSSMNSVLSAAAKKKVPVIAYDRLLTGTKDVDYQATFDNVRVGMMQGSLLVDRLGLTDGAAGPFNLEVFGGSGNDANSAPFLKGSMMILQPYITSGQLVIRTGETKLAQVSTLNWEGAAAAARMKRLLTQSYQHSRVDAVLAPNDGIAMAIIKVLTADGYGTKANPLPVISGQDAELASMKSIIAGQQAGTIYKDTRELAKATVQMGNALLTGVKPMVNDTKTFNNGVKIVPTYLLPPINIDKNNYKTLLVGGGYYTAAQLA